MISYTYEIVGIDENARCMELRYSSPGKQTLHVGTRLPYVGETVDQVAAMYVPIATWVEAERPVVVPAAGTTGSYTAPADMLPTLERAKQEKLAAIAVWRYRLEIGGVTINGVRVQTDRESQATLTGALVSMNEGLLTSINWKDSSGTFVTLTKPELVAVASAVAQHVQSSFDAEKVYVEQVHACTTIEEVNAITLP